jgi:uncharacterized protein YbjT (DUF2867 family)
MSCSEKTVLVLGATGRQGGATARHLLEKGWPVRVLVRDPNKPAAQALRDEGADVVQGDFDDKESLSTAMRGVHGVFSVQAFGGPAVDGEVLQSKGIVDAAKSAGVQHLVYSSVQSAEDFARLGGDTVKWDIEQYVRSSGLPFTILRPCLFMDDLLGEQYGVPNGVFSIAFETDVEVGLISSDDIGAFAALALEHPEHWLGKTVEIAGDAPTPVEIAAAISAALGQAIAYHQVPVDVIRQQSPQIGAAFDFLNKVGYPVDIVALRQHHPDLMTLETWLQKTIKA